ncbi:fructose-bisphosphate aldolase [Streptomyces sp. NPDC057638]|uniref:fructose-bisphosphate aldolase n=1 Tax=Streptomyces sp. NPDC057638 TaxID=3346190 RepID=UPI0036977470
MSSNGKTVRLGRIIPGVRTVMVPFDDDLINGPYAGLADPVTRVREVALGGADAVLGFPRLLARYTERGVRVPFVANLTASTVLGAHTRKVVVGSVERAVREGCDGVAVHVNVSDRHEPEMLAALGAVAEGCERWGMPLLAIMYPRRARDGVDDNYLDLKADDRAHYVDLVRHCVRIAAELGADVVKTQYTGDPESFASVITASMGVPLIVAGGPRTPVREALGNAHGAVTAGAAGVCFGRQTYNRTDITGFVRMLCSVVHEGRAPEDVLAGQRDVAGVIPGQ